MSKASRQAKKDAELIALQDEFAEFVIAAARRCADGEWGMFDTNYSRSRDVLYGRLRSKTTLKLIELADRIEELRRECGAVESFAPLERFRFYSKCFGPNDPGEPKLARMLLDDLGIKA